MRAVIVIPARYASTRLPHKMLLAESGMPLIQHTYLRAKQSRLATRVMVATDDRRIADVVKQFGGEVVMTDPDHPSGTDRLAEVATRYASDADVMVNIQGDEPECDPHDIDTLITLFQSQSSSIAMATLVCRFAPGRLEGPGSPLDPNCVKAVLGKPIQKNRQLNEMDNRLPKDNIIGYEALYFSRSLIPYPRDVGGKILQSQDYYMHCGVYAYTPEFLKTFVALPQGQNEKSEKLEQLRVLENGYRIVAGVVESATPGIDTRDDYEAFVQRWLAHQPLETVV